jgi:hypothetical protein
VYPRYFAARSTGPRPLGTPVPALLAQVRDVFRLGLGGPEVCVVADLKGHLHVFGAPDLLPERLRTQLLHRELAGGRPRTLDVAELWLFDPQVVEQPVNTPGINDPVHLFGRLYGPFGGVRAPSVIEGGLTVTRADVLAGLVDELPYTYVAPGVDGAGPVCSHHLLLPGDTADALAGGEGVVLAWPTIPAELDPHDLANEGLCTSLLFDLLAAMQVDLRAVDPGAPFARRELPVPSRSDAARALEDEGWEIRGDTAVRLDPSLKHGVGSLLTSVFGVPDAMTRALPREGTLAEFVTITRDVLAELPGWPDARAATLRARVRPAIAPPAPSGTVPRLPPHTPRPSGSSTPSSTAPPPRPEGPAHRSPRAAVPAEPPAWLHDFSASPLRPPARRTTVRTPAAGGGRVDGTAQPAAPAIPDWMKDFDR